MNTTLRFNADGLPVIQGHLTVLPSQMAQELIQGCLDVPLETLRAMIASVDPSRWEEWEREQCEHELTIMTNILNHRVNQGECDGV